MCSIHYLLLNCIIFFHLSPQLTYWSKFSHKDHLNEFNQKDHYLKDQISNNHQINQINLLIDQQSSSEYHLNYLNQNSLINQFKFIHLHYSNLSLFIDSKSSICSSSYLKSSTNLIDFSKTTIKLLNQKTNLKSKSFKILNQQFSSTKGNHVIDFINSLPSLLNVSILSVLFKFFDTSQFRSAKILGQKWTINNIIGVYAASSDTKGVHRKLTFFNIFF